jgi:glucan phosphoethanolaminetransferase (alkaline phosphatase superfamily)
MADTQPSLNKQSVWGIVLSGAGIVVAGASLLAQFFNIDNGTSGQLTVDTNMKTTMWPVVLSFVFLLVGGMLYIFFDTTQKPYLWVFGMSFLSLFLANLAVLMSTYQVQITKV